MLSLRIELRIDLLQKLIGSLSRLSIRTVIDELPDRHLRRELGQSTKVIAVPMRCNEVIDLLKPGILHCIDDTSRVAGCRSASVARIDEQRFAGRGNEERG